MCQTFAANLVEIETTDEMTYLNSLLLDIYNYNSASYRVWVGLKRDSDNIFRWEIGGGNVSENSEMWEPGAPNNNDECVRLKLMEFDNVYKMRGKPACANGGGLQLGICEKQIHAETTDSASTLASTSGKY